MELKQQIISLELAKKLKELGVLQKSLFQWSMIPWEEVNWYITQEEPITGIAAFTVAELGEFLPEKVVFGNYQKRTGGKWRMNFGDMEISGDTEAEMKGKMLVYLLENKLIIL